MFVSILFLCNEGWSLPIAISFPGNIAEWSGGMKQRLAFFVCTQYCYYYYVNLYYGVTLEDIRTGC